jgi:hypothetical protein
MEGEPVESGQFIINEKVHVIFPVVYKTER